MIIVGIRRSIAALTAPVVAGICLLPILSGHPWRHEVFWALFSYQRVTILVAVVAAGVGGYEGYRWSSYRPSIALSPRRLAVPANLIIFSLVWHLVVFLGFAVVVAGIAVRNGAPLFYDWESPLSLATSCAAIAFANTTGFVAGWRLRSPAVAPIAAMGTYASYILLASGGYEKATRLGGAGSSLLGLRISTAVTVGRLLVYGAGAALVAVVVSRARAQSELPPPRPARLLLSAGFVLGVLVLANAPGQIFERRQVQVDCGGGHPELCLNRGYESERLDLAAKYGALTTTMERADLPAPHGFSQDPTDLSRVTFEPPGVQQNPDALIANFMHYYFDKTKCTLKTPAQRKAFVELGTWLAIGQGRRAPKSSNVTVEDVRSAITELRTCTT